MVAALLVRRGQYLQRGLDDPFPTAAGSGFATPASQSPAPGQAAQVLQQASQQQALNRSLLKVTRMLDESELGMTLVSNSPDLPSRRSTAAIDLLSNNPNLLESLRRAHMGNYQVVLSLLSSLDHGRELKRLVDIIIDNCDQVINLRENVIEYRVKYSVAKGEDKNGHSWLDKAVRSVSRSSRNMPDPSSNNTSTSSSLRRTSRAMSGWSREPSSPRGSRPAPRSGSGLKLDGGMLTRQPNQSPPTPLGRQAVRVCSSERPQRHLTLARPRRQARPA